MTRPADVRPAKFSGITESDFMSYGFHRHRRLDEKKGCATLADPITHRAETLACIGQLAAQRAFGDMQLLCRVGHRHWAP
jgi:hypothetical protein